MPPVEIDESVLAAQQRVVGFVNQALTNPKTRTRVLEIQQELDPNFTAPELETKTYVDGAIGELKTMLGTFIDETKKTAEEQKAAAERAALEQKWATGRVAAQNRGYDTAGMEKLEEYMQKNGLIDHSIAMAAFERENPLPPPIATGDNRWGFFDAQTTESPDLKDLFEGREDAFLNKQIAATLAEVRGQR